jgi:hypothetical protein
VNKVNTALLGSVMGIAAVAACASERSVGADESVARIELSSSSHTLLPGDSVQLRATAYDATGTVMARAPIAWLSSEASVATVGSAGLVRGIGAGAARITASSAGRSATADIVVISGPTGGQTRGDTIFSEGFESGSLAAWDDGVDQSRHRIVSGPGVARSGDRALEITYPAGADGGWLTKFLMPGYNAVHVSFHVRYEPNWSGGTKLLALYGSRVDNRWSGYGQAGRCPTGTDFFTTMIVTEPGIENEAGTAFYTYYPAMRREPDGTTCWGVAGDGTETHHPPRSISRGGWHRIDFQVLLNTPGQRNAEQRYWIDGVLRGEWTGFSFRDTDQLRLNGVQISANATAVSSPRRMYVDDLVVTTLRSLPQATASTPWSAQPAPKVHCARRVVPFPAAQHRHSEQLC